MLLQTNIHVKHRQVRFYTLRRMALAFALIKQMLKLENRSKDFGKPSSNLCKKQWSLFTPSPIGIEGLRPNKNNKSACCGRKWLVFGSDGTADVYMYSMGSRIMPVCCWSIFPSDCGPPDLLATPRRTSTCSSNFLNKCVLGVRCVYTDQNC